MKTAPVYGASAYGRRISFRIVGHEGTLWRAVKVCLHESCERAVVKRDWCETHYKAWLRSQPKCRAGGCNNTLQAAECKTRGDYCRPHEQLALTTRSAAAQEKSLKRFREGIEPDWELGCWLWKETPDEGYGKFHAGGLWLAHRFSYVWFMGGHERQKTLDHIFNRPLCTRPDHMEPISDTINTKRRDERAFAPGGIGYPSKAAG